MDQIWVVESVYFLTFSSWDITYTQGKRHWYSGLSCFYHKLQVFDAWASCFIRAPPHTRPRHPVIPLASVDSSKTKRHNLDVMVTPENVSIVTCLSSTDLYMQTLSLSRVTISCTQAGHCMMFGSFGELPRCHHNLA